MKRNRDQANPAANTPDRRLTPANHLRHAAHAPTGSHAEHYHLAAATAEALTRILAHLQTSRPDLTDILDDLTEP